MSLSLNGTTGIPANAAGFLVGQVCTFAMTTPPPGFVKCNGQALSRVIYAALFAAIGTTYGAGDGSTTFNVPETRGEFIRCLDDGRGVDTGRALGAAQAMAVQGHAHSTNYAGDAGAINYGNDATPLPRNTVTQGGTTSGQMTSVTGSAETRPRNVAFLACIFAGV